LAAQNLSQRTVLSPVVVVVVVVVVVIRMMVLMIMLTNIKWWGSVLWNY